MWTCHQDRTFPVHQESNLVPAHVLQNQDNLCCIELYLLQAEALFPAYLVIQLPCTDQQL